MKKILTIKIEVNTEHHAKDTWVKQSDFIESEIDESLRTIGDFESRKYRNCSGKTFTGATNYTVSVKHIHQVKTDKKS